MIGGIILNFLVGIFNFIMIFFDLNSINLAPAIYFIGFAIIKIIFLISKRKGNELNAIRCFLIGSLLFYIYLPITIIYRLSAHKTTSFPFDFIFILYILLGLIRLIYSIVSFFVKRNKNNNYEFILATHGIITAFYFYLLTYLAYIGKLGITDVQSATFIVLYVIISVFILLEIIATYIYVNRYRNLKINLIEKDKN